MHTCVIYLALHSLNGQIELSNILNSWCRLKALWAQAEEARCICLVGWSRFGNKGILGYRLRKTPDDTPTPGHCPTGSLCPALH